MMSHALSDVLFVGSIMINLSVAYYNGRLDMWDFIEKRDEWREQETPWRGPYPAPKCNWLRMSFPVVLTSIACLFLAI